MEAQAASGGAERRSGGEASPESAPANPTDAVIKEGTKALRGILGF
jgi:hypothetical protein